MVSSVFEIDVQNSQKPWGVECADGSLSDVQTRACGGGTGALRCERLLKLLLRAGSTSGDFCRLLLSPGDDARVILLQL